VNHSNATVVKNFVTGGGDGEVVIGIIKLARTITEIEHPAPSEDVAPVQIAATAHMNGASQVVGLA
jgi:hypothetical protein